MAGAGLKSRSTWPVDRLSFATRWPDPVDRRELAGDVDVSPLPRTLHTRLLTWGAKDETAPVKRLNEKTLLRDVGLGSLRAFVG